MPFSDPEHNIAQFNLPEGALVADFGVGSGAYAIAAGRRVGSEGRVYAIDVQQSLLQKVKNEAMKQHVANIEVIWGDVEHPGGTSLKDHLVDAVIVSNILFQIEDKPGLMREIKRVLRPKGKVLVVDWTDSFGGMGPHPEHVFPAAAAQKLFTDAGFAVEKTISAGDHHYGFVFRGQ